MPDTMPHPSYRAADVLTGERGWGQDRIDYLEWEELMGETDCPNGCAVEPDGICPHNWLSAGRTAGVI
jgi:hypothetical protein